MNVFQAMLTQWHRSGMNGARTGLDYAALPVVLGLKRIQKKQWPELFEDIQTLEVYALEHLAKQK